MKTTLLRSDVEKSHVEKKLKYFYEGIIGFAPAGENGFGYDPLFFVPEYNMTTAQMESELKDKISHRGKAIRLMIKQLEDNIIKE